MKFHTIIFGAHATGLNVAAQLQHTQANTRARAGAAAVDGAPSTQNILLVDEDPQRLKQAEEHGLQTTQINYMEDDDLATIGIGSHVRQVFCLLEDESSNVFLILSTRALDPGLHIVTISESHHSAARLHAAGANKVINPHEITAHRIYSILRKPLIVDILENTVFGNADLEIAEVSLPGGSDLLGQRLRDLDINRRHNLIAVDVLTSATPATQTPQSAGYSHRLQAGDTLVIVGPQAALLAFREQLAGLDANTLHQTDW